MWYEILEILEISSNNIHLEWNPKSWEEVEEKRAKLTELLGSYEDATEVVNLAMIGELTILTNKYPY